MSGDQSYEDENAEDNLEACVDSLSRKLAAYAETLDGRERRILRLLLYWAMDPIDRTALVAPDGLFDSDELEILRRIEEKG